LCVAPAPCEGTVALSCHVRGIVIMFPIGRQVCARTMAPRADEPSRMQG